MKSIIWRYYAYSLFANMLFISAILVPFFTQWGHINLFQVQILQSWFSLWFFVFEVPTGIVADRLGRRYTLTGGAIIGAIAIIIYGSFANFYIFLLGEFLFALGTSLISGADEALFYELLKEQGKEHESKIYFGKAQSFQLGGIFVGAILGGIIANKFGLNMPFVFSSIPLLLAGCIAWSFQEPSKQYEKKLSKESVFSNLKNGYTFLLHHKTLRLLALDSIVVSMAAYFVIWYYQPLLQNIGISIALFGLFQALLVGTQILVSQNFAFLEKLFRSTTGYLRFSALITALSFILVALLPNLLTITIFIVCAGGLGLSRGTLISSYMNKHISSENRATVLSSVSTFRRLSIAVVNPIIGLIAFHSLPIALFVLGLIPLALVFFSPIEQNMFG